MSLERKLNVTKDEAVHKRKDASTGLLPSEKLPISTLIYFIPQRMEQEILMIRDHHAWEPLFEFVHGFRHPKPARHR